VEKPKKIGKIDPKAAVETARIEPSIHERVVPLNHHEAFALETIHRASIRTMLSDPLHHQGETSGQKAPAENRRAERQERTGSGDGMRPVKQITDASLDHQHRQGEKSAHAEPPRE
jgi:hypothetical protein